MPQKASAEKAVRDIRPAWQSAITPALQHARSGYGRWPPGLRPGWPLHRSLRHLRRVGCPMSAS
jgi:hypothetical protein